MPNKNTNQNLKTPDNIFTSNINQLHPKKKSQYKPKADNNILKVEEQCLYAISAADRENIGRGNGAWWFIWMTIFVILLYVFTMLPSLLNGTSLNTPKEHLIYGIGGILVFIIGSLPFYIRWRRVLPICFNRQTKIIGTWHKGQLWTTHWDFVEAHSKTLTIPAPVPYKLGVVGINLYPENSPKKQESITVPIAGTETQSTSPHEASGMAWEYIRMFMEKGNQSIPVPNQAVEKHLSGWKQAFKKHSPFPLIKKDSDTFGWIIIDLLLIPFNVITAPISIPTELIYIGLDKVLPQRKMPKPLRDLSQAGS